MNPPKSDWLVSVPLSELVKLQNMTSDFEALRMENAQLRREMDGLRRIQSECMQVLGDLRRSLRSNKSA